MRRVRADGEQSVRQSGQHSAESERRQCEREERPPLEPEPAVVGAVRVGGREGGEGGRREGEFLKLQKVA